MKPRRIRNNKYPPFSMLYGLIFNENKTTARKSYYRPYDHIIKVTRAVQRVKTILCALYIQCTVYIYVYLPTSFRNVTLCIVYYIRTYKRVLHSIEIYRIEWWITNHNMSILHIIHRRVIDFIYIFILIYNIYINGWC